MFVLCTAGTTHVLYRLGRKGGWAEDVRNSAGRSARSSVAFLYEHLTAFQSIPYTFWSYACNLPVASCAGSRRYAPRPPCRRQTQTWGDNTSSIIKAPSCRHEMLVFRVSCSVGAELAIRKISRSRFVFVFRVSCFAFRVSRVPRGAG